MVDLDNNSTSHQLVEKAATLYSLVDCNLCTLEVMSLVGLNKAYCGTKDFLILGVRISSLEVDLRVPGNRDEFPFSLPSGLNRANLPPVCKFSEKSSLEWAKTYRHRD